MSDGQRAHHLADLHGGHVGATGVHPGAHRRIDGQVVDLDNEFPVASGRLGFLDNRPVAGLRQAHRTGGPPALNVHACHDTAAWAGGTSWSGDKSREVSAAQSRAARPAGSSAVTGTTATVSAPAAR